MEFATRVWASHQPHIVVHAAQTRVCLRSSKGERRIATLIDSPYSPEGEASFTIPANGIA
jgi:DNA repair protein RadA